MVDEDVVCALRDALGDALGEVRAVQIDETWLSLEIGGLLGAVDVLMNRCGVWHLSTITGLDDGQGIRLLYHFWRGHGLTLCVWLPYEAPTVPTLTRLIPGAAFYEREVAEMLGVTFEGHQGLEPLLLPEDWDAGPPLRRERAEEGDDAVAADAGGD